VTAENGNLELPAKPDDRDWVLKLTHIEKEPNE
jgi:hypothetical protein